MSPDLFAKLDNPAWWALTGAQQQFATGAEYVKRYQRHILPFAAYKHGINADISKLDHWLQSGEIFYLIGDLPLLPTNWTLIKELPCAQMIMKQPAGTEENSIPISQLTSSHKTEMFKLTNKVQPGYFYPDTHLLGNYYGIWQQEKLVAIAGERMRMAQLTEISAVCTDPAYTGRKYAQHLVTHLCHINLQKGNIPFLHVLQSNERAIRLYEYLGFIHRRIISFWKIRKEY
jgi:hypothetical protein